MMIRARVAFFFGLVIGASLLVAPLSASAAEPHCNSYRNIFLVGTSDMYRQPTFGRDGQYECQMREGDHGDGVKILQYTITCHGRALNPDGSLRVQRDGTFGPITKSALALVQGDLHISADGQYGPQTRGAIWHWPIFHNDPSGWWFYGCL